MVPEDHGRSPKFIARPMFRGVIIGHFGFLPFKPLLIHFAVGHKNPGNRGDRNAERSQVG